MEKNSNQVRVALSYTVDKTNADRNHLQSTVAGCQGKVEDFMRIGSDSIILEKVDDFEWKITAYVNAEKADCFE